MPTTRTDIWRKIFAGSTIAVDVEADDSVGALQAKLEAMTGIHCGGHELICRGQHIRTVHVPISDCGIENEATLLLAFQGHGGMLDDARPGERAPKRRRIMRGGGSVDTAFEDTCILRRCMHRVHRFSPGVEGRVLLEDADRCASLGYWSLIASGRADQSTVSVSLLHAASRAGRVDAVKSLVSDYGLDANARGSIGWTALHTAMVQSQEDVVRQLLSLGAEDVATEDGVHASALRPALWARATGEEVAAAASWRHHCVQDAVDDLERMIGCGPAVTKGLCRGVCAAVETLGTAVVQETCSWQLSMGRLGIRKRTVLAAAAATGRCSLCRVCLELGADMDTADDRGDTPLHVACRKGRFDCSRLLLNRGADVDKPNRRGATPLHVACQEGHFRCVRLLLDRNADVNKVMGDGATSLLVASRKGRLHCTRLLLHCGAEVDKATGNGVTPLHMACWYNRRHVASHLFECGADPTKQSKRGRTAVNYARSFWVYDPELADAVELACRDREAAIERLRGMDAEHLRQDPACS